MGALSDISKSGLTLPDDLLRELRELVDSRDLEEEEKSDIDGPFYDGRKHLWLYRTPDPVPGNEDIVNDPNYYQKIPKEWIDKWRSKDIKVQDYWPKGCPEKLPKGFQEFIMSSWDRFDSITAYEPFYVYCEQARRWGEEKATAESFTRFSQEWIDYCLKDIDRCRQNHLYALDRHLWIKDDSQPSGQRKYKASTPQALLCFLKNLKLSYVILKGRQAAITSTEMALAAVRAKVLRSYKGTIVTDDVEVTGKNIFEDKFWNSSQRMPWWFQAKHVPHKSSLRVMYDFEAGKGKANSKRSTSEFGVLSGKDTQTINGTTPTDLYIDEGQNVSTLAKIVDERRPTQLAVVDGIMRVFRASYIWGTGSSSDKGKGALEDLYKQLKNSVAAGHETDGWVVLFFDAFCRPYMSKDIYFKEYRKYVGDGFKETKGRSVEEKKAMFASHYPMSDEDAFTRNENGIVPMIWVKKNLDRITGKYPGGPDKGRFFPIYEKADVMPKGLHQPYRIKGVEFRKAELIDLHAPVSMFRDREDGMIDNYIQGTDPIQSEVGQSYMASTIMAASAFRFEKEGVKYNVQAPVCIVNGRTPNPKDIFLQTKLMGMYYANHGQTACPELVEYNQGHNYLEYIHSPFLNMQDSLMLRAELPTGYSVGSQTYGIDMKEQVKSRLHIDLLELNQALSDNIWFREYFLQLKNMEHEENGKSNKWGTKDTRRFYDDLVMSMVLAYVAMKYKYAGTMPKKIGTSMAPEYVSEMVRVSLPDNTWVWGEKQTRIDYAA